MMSELENAKNIFSIIVFHLLVPSLDVGSDVRMVSKLYGIRNNFYNDTTENPPKMKQIETGYFYSVLFPFLLNYLGKPQNKTLPSIIRPPVILDLTLTFLLTGCYP